MLHGVNEDSKAWRSYLPKVTSPGRWGVQKLSPRLILVTPHLWASLQVLPPCESEALVMDVNEAPG